MLALLPFIRKVKVLLAQSCLALCHPVGSPPGSSVHGFLQARKNTGVGCHALLQGIFLTQQLNPNLPNCRPILYHLSHQGSLLYSYLNKPWASQVELVVKNLPASAGDIRDVGLIPELERSPGERRAWQLTPVFLPEESREQRSLVGYSPWGQKEPGAT